MKELLLAAVLLVLMPIYALVVVVAGLYNVTASLLRSFGVISKLSAVEHRESLGAALAWPLDDRSYDNEFIRREEMHSQRPQLHHENL